MHAKDDCLSVDIYCDLNLSTIVKSYEQPSNVQNEFKKN